MKRKKALITIIGMIAVLIIIIIVHIGSKSERLINKLDLGYLYLTEMDYDAAIVAFQEAIIIDPNSVDAHLGLAEAYIGKQENEIAIELLTTAIDTIDDNRLEIKLKEIIEENRGSQNVVNSERKPDLSVKLVRNIQLCQG